MLQIRDTSTSPPEKKWTYFVRETCHEVSVPAYRNLRNAVAAHCKGNGIAIPSEEDIVQYICDNQYVECRDGRNVYDNDWAKGRFVHPDEAAVPRDRWPLWANALALVAREPDRGIGDTIARTVGPFGGNAFKAWHLIIFGRACSCTTRQDRFNSKYPLVWQEIPVTQ